jgi:hypothetical protein
MFWMLGSYRQTGPAPVPSPCAPLTCPRIQRRIASTPNRPTSSLRTPTLSWRPPLKLMTPLKKKLQKQLQDTCQAKSQKDTKDQAPTRGVSREGLPYGLGEMLAKEADGNSKREQISKELSAVPLVRVMKDATPPSKPTIIYSGAPTSNNSKAQVAA